MAIEAVTALAAKEIGTQASREAALQTAREIAQKMAVETTGQGGNEVQTAMMERQAMQEGFRLGEISENQREGRELCRQKEADAAEELRRKLDATENRPAVEEIQETPKAPEVGEQGAPIESAGVSEEAGAAEIQKANIAELEELKGEYADDLIARSEAPETLNKKEIVGAEYEKISPEQDQAKRAEFAISKSDLISQWEQKHGLKWPKYTEQVFYKGKVIRDIGWKYDCHHIQPLTYNGKNEVGNITPLHALEHCDHQGIHAFTSPCSRMESLLNFKETA